jgi:hypothetical protein
MLPRRRPACPGAGPSTQGVIPSVIRRLIPILAVVALFLAACGPAAAPTPPALDARQVVTKGIDATTKLKSFHAAVVLDGTVNIPQMGTGSLKLKGTELAGDFDLANKQAHLTFSVPTLLGLEGEVVATEAATYIKTSLTGPKWQKQENDAGVLPDEVQDPTKALSDVEAFLDREGVELRNLDDAACGESTCYHVQLTIPSEALNDAAASAGTSASDVVGEALVIDLQFDRTTLYLTSASTSVEAEEMGTLNATLTLSAFDQPVAVTTPPDAEVDSSGGGFSFP